MNSKKFNLLQDIYYLNEYVSLYLKEEEICFDFIYQEKDLLFINKAIKRPIKKIGNRLIEDGYYDLETAYGYGGFYTNAEDHDFLHRAMSEYEQRCKDENIIAEFIRFHPFNHFPCEYAMFLDFNVLDRSIVIKSISEDVLSSYSSKMRNTIKRAYEKVIVQKSVNIEKFRELYNKTMTKNNASAFYYFPKSYYQELLCNGNVELYEIKYKNEIVSMGFFMFGRDIGHYHLSANSEISYKINANYALLHYAFGEAKKRGIQYFSLGGGTTSDKNDSLFRFKKKFSKETTPFYISGKIYNKNIYNEYNSMWQKQSKEDIKYFLKYRLEIV